MILNGPHVGGNTHLPTSSHSLVVMDEIYSTAGTPKRRLFVLRSKGVQIQIMIWFPQWDTANAEIKAPLLRTQSLEVLPLKAGVRQHTAMHASPIARDFLLELISTLPVHSPAFFSKTFPEFFLCYLFLCGPAK